MRTRALTKKHTPIDKSKLFCGTAGTWEDRAYLDSMREARCLVTGRYGTDDESIDPAHLRIGFYGAGIKPADFHCLPVTHWEHHKQSEIGEGNYWLKTINEHPMLLGELLKGYSVARYIKWKLGNSDMSDRQMVDAIVEMMDG